MKQITVDLRTASLFGPSCKCLELFEDFRYRGYQIDLIAKDWIGDCKESGVVFDDKTGKFERGESQYLWDPKLHPIDFYENLVVPTFENINYKSIPPNKSTLSKIGKRLKALLSPFYFTYPDCAMMYMEPIELRRYHQQQVDKLFTRLTFYDFLNYLQFYLQYKIFRHFKPYADSRGFRYKLKPELIDDNVKTIIADAKKCGVPYVLISANWDDDKKFEKQDDRTRGIFYNETEFQSMVSYVKDLDKYAQQGKIRFVLASKKAVDWDKMIQSDFLDLRNFEEKGLTLSQSLYIIQEITKLTINWPSTFSIWITHCADMLHLTWNDNKDTAKWARNTLNRHSVEQALRLVGVI